MPQQHGMRLEQPAHVELLQAPAVQLGVGSLHRGAPLEVQRLAFIAAHEGTPLRLNRPGFLGDSNP